MMQAVRFEPNKHFGDICAWAKQRKMPEPAVEMFPECGRVVEGVCAIFLYRTDSKLGLIENLISNKKARGLSEAMDACIEAIEQDARDLGIWMLMASTYVPAVSKRANRMGFETRPEGHFLMVKRLV